jgi:adenylosuccinate synthase
VKGFPSDSSLLYQCTPVYETLGGWQADISGARKLDDLPVNARRYVEFIEEQVKVPVMVATVGPHREQTIWFKH